jgi:hypothetical protein
METTPIARATMTPITIPIIAPVERPALVSAAGGGLTTVTVDTVAVTA